MREATDIEVFGKVTGLMRCKECDLIAVKHWVEVPIASLAGAVYYSALVHS